MHRTSSQGGRPRAPRLRLSVSSSPVRDSVTETPTSPAKSVKGMLQEEQDFAPQNSPMSLCPLEQPSSPAPQLPDIDLRPPEKNLRNLRAYRGHSSFDLQQSLPSVDSKLSDLALTDSSGAGDESEFGGTSTTSLQPRPLATRMFKSNPLPQALRKDSLVLANSVQQSDSSEKQPSIPDGVSLFQFNQDYSPIMEREKAKDIPGLDTFAQFSNNSNNSNNNNNNMNNRLSHARKSRAASQHSLFAPYLGAEELNAIAQQAKGGKAANSEKLRTMLGVYFLTLKEINKAFPDDLESGHASGDEASGRRTPRSAVDNVPIFGAFGRSTPPPPPPPIPADVLRARSVRSASSPHPAHGHVLESRSAERLRDNRSKTAALRKKVSMAGPTPLPLELPPKSRKFSEAIGPKTPYPRTSEPLRVSNLPPPPPLPPMSRIPVPEPLNLPSTQPSQAPALPPPPPPPPPPPTAASPRKGSAAILHNGSLAYIKPNAPHVSADTVLTLRVRRRQAPGHERIATLRVPADADQATARKWSTAGLPATAVAVDSSIGTAVVPPAATTNATSAGHKAAEQVPQEKTTPRLNFDDSALFDGLQKQYYANLLGSTPLSRAWRRFLAARALQRIRVVHLDVASAASALPTTLSGNTTGSSAFPGRLTNPFAATPNQAEAQGRVGSLAPLHLRAHDPRATEGDSTRRQSNVMNSSSRVTSRSAPAPLTIPPRFLARRGLDDTFSEAHMLQHFRKPRRGRQRYAWVYWAHRVARDVDEEYEYDAETGIVSATEGQGFLVGATRPGAVPGGLEFVEGWCWWRITYAALVVVVGGILISLLWILLGPQDPLSRRIMALGADGAAATDMPAGLGLGNAAGRVVAGALLGLLWVLLGACSMAAWLLVSYLTM